eukprot:COSAG02_NODE_27_length_51735_cov_86.076749_7_plen_344_part_00
MLNGASNQLTEMISPALIFQQLWALAANASSLFYFVDNVSDMLPVPLSTAAALAFAWDPQQFVAENGDWNATQLSFLKNWSLVQYGDAVADEAAALYADYFNIPHVHEGLSDEWIGRLLGSLGSGGAQALHSQGTIDNATKSAAAKALAQVQPSLPACAKLHSGALALAGKVPSRRQLFYRRHMLWNSACQHFGAQSIAELSQSLLAFEDGATTAAIAHANASLAALDSLFEAQRAAEGSGEWSGLFYGDRLPYTTLQSRRRSVLQYREALLKRAAVFDSSKGYYSFYDYQKPALANYPLCARTRCASLWFVAVISISVANYFGAVDGAASITVMSTTSAISC